MKNREIFVSNYKNLKSAFNNHFPPDSRLTTAGFLTYYNFLFDSSINFLREILTEEGIPRNQLEALRNILKKAFKIGLITDEENWLKAIGLIIELANSTDIRKVKEKLEEMNRIMPAFDHLKLEI